MNRDVLYLEGFCGFHSIGSLNEPRPVANCPQSAADHAGCGFAAGCVWLQQRYGHGPLGQGSIKPSFSCSISRYPFQRPPPFFYIHRKRGDTLPIAALLMHQVIAGRRGHGCASLKVRHFQTKTSLPHHLRSLRVEAPGGERCGSGKRWPWRQYRGTQSPATP